MYDVAQEYIYNMDETGFQIGQNQADYVVYNFTQGRPVEEGSENTKWITIIECIAVKSSIKPYIILRANSQRQTGFLTQKSSQISSTPFLREDGPTTSLLSTGYRVFSFRRPQMTENVEFLSLIIQKVIFPANFSIFVWKTTSIYYFCPPARPTSFNRLIWVLFRLWRANIARR
jgi:hypothetical protein